MLSSSQKGISSLKETEIFPSSPTLIKSLNINKSIKEEYIAKRNKLIELKQSNEIFDSRLREYQNQDVAFLSKLSKGKGVFSEQRTGKTPTVLVTMREKNQTRNIIFVPKSAVYQWITEYKKWHKGPVYTVLQSWNQERRKKAYEEYKGTLIVNHDKAWVDYDILLSNFRNADAIILDEAHILRKYTNTNSRTKKATEYKKQKQIYNSAKVSMALIRLRKACKDAYALTGTPTGIAKHEIYGILCFLFPTMFKSYWKFIEYYFDIHYDFSMTYSLGFTKKEIRDFKPNKQKELLEFIETFSVQRKRKEVMKWLPLQDIETVFLDPTPNQRKWHEELEQYYETDKIICENELAVMMAQRQLTICPAIYGFKEVGPKFEWIKDRLKDYPKRKYVIVSKFSKILHKLNVYLKHNKTAVLTGKNTITQREEIRKKYQSGEIQILIANIEVVNVAMTLSKGEELIFLDESLIAIENEQTEDRIIPITKEEKEEKECQLVTKLYLRDTIDMYLKENIEGKKEEIEIINNYKKYLKENRHEKPRN